MAQVPNIQSTHSRCIIYSRFRKTLRTKLNVGDSFLLPLAINNYPLDRPKNSDDFSV